MMDNAEIFKNFTAILSVEVFHNCEFMIDLFKMCLFVFS